MCPLCGKSELKRVTGDYETAFVDDAGNERELLVRNVAREECPHCGEAFLDEEATQKIENMRLHALRRLSPAKIRGFRETLKKSQTEMARLLGLGDKTYSRWESGSYIQNASSDRYLRLLMADAANVTILEDLANSDFTPAMPASEAPTSETHFSFIVTSKILLETASRFTNMMITGSTFIPGRT